MPILTLKISGSERCVTNWKKTWTDKDYQILKKHQNLCCQQFEQFFTIFLHDLIEFIRLTSHFIEKVTRLR